MQALGGGQKGNSTSSFHSSQMGGVVSAEGAPSEDNFFLWGEFFLWDKGGLGIYHPFLFSKHIHFYALVLMIG